jgi:4-hydroxythreonine-4-phosphate dehydrogenase
MTAVQAARAGIVQAVVTAPVSKHALHRAGFPYPGQTEFLQTLTGSPRVAMILAAGGFRVGLATIHLPLRSVARALTPALLASRLETIHGALVHDWGIRRPSIAVLALNPHAGEAGDLGHEERTVIGPVLRTLRRRGLDLHGPFPADAFFGRGMHRRFSAVAAMYHDQGLIPLKMSAQGRAVNVSAGLPIIRTSPDHGTAFDIAGRWSADPSSMIEAVRLAARLARTRRASAARRQR